MRIYEPILFFNLLPLAVLPVMSLVAGSTFQLLGCAVWFIGHGYHLDVRDSCRSIFERGRLLLALLHCFDKRLDHVVFCASQPK
jgi:hypothetical protein